MPVLFSILRGITLLRLYLYKLIIFLNKGKQNLQASMKILLVCKNIETKLDLTLVEINITCEVPFYFLNKIVIRKMI